MLVVRSPLARCFRRGLATHARAPSLAPRRLAAAAAASGAAAAALAACGGGWTVAARCDASSSFSASAAAAAGAPKYLTANFIADAAAKASPSLVNIRVGEGTFHQSSGSGFIVDESGLILTNTHVVKDAMSRMGGGGGQCRVTLSDGVTQLTGVVQHADPVSDIAIVRVRAGRPLPVAKLGSSGSLRPGEFVIALGAPLGLSNSVSAGIISALARTRSDLGMREPRGARPSTLEYIQTDAAINEGNSGGPLLNLEGEVIGVNTMKAKHMDGIAFAVPIDEVKRVTAALLRHGTVPRPYLGLKFVELDAHIARQLREQTAALAGEGGAGGGAAAAVPSRGLYVMHVAPDSPAQRAGVRVGDAITGLDGAPLRTTKELIDGLVDKVDRTVRLELQRGGRGVHAACTVEAMRRQ